MMCFLLFINHPALSIILSGKTQSRISRVIAFGANNSKQIFPGYSKEKACAALDAEIKNCDLPKYILEPRFLIYVFIHITITSQSLPLRSAFSHISSCNSNVHCFSAQGLGVHFSVAIGERHVTSSDTLSSTVIQSNHSPIRCDFPFITSL